MTYADIPDLTGIKKILVIKHRHLGDVLLTTPVFGALKKAMPDAQIHAYIYAEAAMMLEGHPAISRLILYDRKMKKKSIVQRLFYEYRLLKDLREQKYDLVINLTEGDRGAIAARVSKASIRVGFEPKGKWQKKGYTHVAKSAPTLRHTVERNLDALRRIGIHAGWEERELYFHIPASLRAKTPKHPFILIHPTSRWRFKCWPVKKMAALVDLLTKSGKQVVVTSGPDPIEVEMAQSITKGSSALNLAGKISLKELGALIDACQFLLCVDSLPFHLASALKKPVIALFGPTSEITWGPWRNQNALIITQPFSCRPCYQDGCGGSKKSDCLETISVQTVMEAIVRIENLLQNNNSSHLDERGALPSSQRPKLDLLE